jgi:hypothetical protein
MKPIKGAAALIFPAALLAGCSSSHSPNATSEGQAPIVSQSAPSSTSTSTSSAPGAYDSEGGQAEGEAGAREREKQVQQRIHPGGTPGELFKKAQGPGTAKDWFCGVVDGNFAGTVQGTNAYTPNDMSTATPAFTKQTGKWDIGVHDWGPASRSEDAACPRALKFYADFLSAPLSGMRTSISGSGIWYYDFQDARCFVDEDTYGDHYLSCGVDKTPGTDVDVFVAFVR